MAAVLGTDGTQVYIQTQTSGVKAKSEQFLVLMRLLSANSPANLEERQRAILALGTLNDPQALRFSCISWAMKQRSGYLMPFSKLW